jgi:hypothetical protein
VPPSLGLFDVSRVLVPPSLGLFDIPRVLGTVATSRLRRKENEI